MCTREKAGPSTRNSSRYAPFPSNRKCFRCFKEGHFARQCSKERRRTFHKQSSSPVHDNARRQQAPSPPTAVDEVLNKRAMKKSIINLQGNEDGDMNDHSSDEDSKTEYVNLLFHDNIGTPKVSTAKNLLVSCKEVIGQPSTPQKVTKSQKVTKKFLSRINLRKSERISQKQKKKKKS
jgi:hypothetical protein